VFAIRIVGFLLTLQVSGIAPLAHPPDEAQRITIPAGVRLILRLTGTITSEPTPANAAALITISDMTVDDVVVIPKGAGAAFRVSTKDRRRLSTPGEVVIDVDGIYTRTGRLVLPLTGSERRVGQQRCVERDCVVVLLLPWIKGYAASVPAGTLITARVSQTTSFDNELLKHLSIELSKPEPILLPSRLSPKR
jgi:hypothetical protein